MSDGQVTQSDAKQGDVCLGGHLSTEKPMRRGRFLAGLGAGGLVVAEAMFGRPASAAASGGCSCCNLVYCPANTSYSSCSGAQCHYIWGCAGTGTTTCNCCEKQVCGGGYIASAYECFVH